MTVLAECETCGYRWEIELKPREKIQCPCCKGIFNMWKVMNDPDNKELLKQLGSQSSTSEERTKEQLDKAKKLIRSLLYVYQLGKNELATARVMAEAEQFLSEAEK